MNNNDAISRGWEPAATQHSMKRRSPWHDYYRQGTYMLTLVIEGRQPLFGRLQGLSDAVPGSPSAPRIEPSALGRAIIDEELAKISRFYPQVEVWKACLMPDHLHLIIRVKEDLPPGKHLGMVVAGFKGGCSKAAMRLGFIGQSGGATQGGGAAQSERSGNGGLSHYASNSSHEDPSKSAAKSNGAAQSGRSGNGGLSHYANHSSNGTIKATVPPPSGGGVLPAAATPAATSAAPPAQTAPSRPAVQPLFEPGYNDKILLHEGQLDNWRAYLDDNPRRLLIKRQHPQFFTVLRALDVAGRRCQAVGNRFLLDIPDKVAVIVHRRYTPAERARLRDEWLACGERGGVLVSAAIAPDEKAIMREAMDRGYAIILLRDNGFPPLYKPSGEAFDACSAGRLLLISPWDHQMERATITRHQCLTLNAIAETIATTTPS